MKKFKKIYIEITNICNLSCDFCPKTKRSLSYMSVELFETILNKVRGSTDYLYFHVMGEPLLHPQIGFFLEKCHEYDYMVNLTTNGTLIDRVSDRLIGKKALRQINFSLHSFDSNASNYSMNTYINKIFDFIDLVRKEGNIKISLRLWNLSKDKKDEKNSYILNRIKKQFELDDTFEDLVSKYNALKIAEDIYLNQAARFDWPNIELNEINTRGFCYGLRDQLAILVDGTVVPCCLDGEGIVRLGNINEDSVSEILQSSRAKELYEGFSNRQVVEELCKKCDYRMRFNI